MINSQYLIEGHATPDEWARCFAYLLAAPGGSLWTSGAPEIERALTAPRLPPAPDVLSPIRQRAADQDAQRAERIAVIREQPKRRRPIEPAYPAWVAPSPVPEPSRHDMLAFMRREAEIKTPLKRGRKPKAVKSA